MNATKKFVRPIVGSQALCAFGCFLLLTGCTVLPPDSGNGGSGPPSNSTDPTNGGADSVGASACGACHESVAARHSLHGHAFQLNQIQGAAPDYPPEATGAGVPSPPEGFDWLDIAYVIGGYVKKARFVDQDGFLLTTGETGVSTQWNLASPPLGTDAHFANYLPDQPGLTPYDASCFQCHATGTRPQDPADPLFQEGREGILGTWREAGIQCEECHGPGSRHFSTNGTTVAIDTSAIYLNSDAAECGKCHSRGTDPNVILAENGFILSESQWPELLASGGHADFDCTFCHDPHASVTYDRENAIRNDCTACHSEQNMAIHEGIEFVRGDYREVLSCESCHMTFATQSAASAGPEIVGPDGRMADTRTHIFRINTENEDFSAVFSNDETTVRKDGQGRAAITVDFVCLRCHNGIGNAFPLTIEFASGIAVGMHDNAQ